MNGHPDPFGMINLMLNITGQIVGLVLIWLLWAGWRLLLDIHRVVMGREGNQ